MINSNIPNKDSLKLYYNIIEYLESTECRGNKRVEEFMRAGKNLLLSEMINKKATKT